MNTFVLAAENIHFLNSFSSNMKLPIVIKEKSYYYSFEQLAFLSPKIFLHYLENTQSFQVEAPSKNIADFLECFDQLDSLFRSSDHVKINHSNAQFFIQIAEKLDNSFLMDECLSISENEVKDFSLSFLHLRSLSSQAKDSLKKFIFMLDGREVRVNRFLFMCASSLLSNLDPSIDTFSINVSEDVFQCFSSFVKVFEGFPFHWKNHNVNTIFSMINLFQIHSLKKFIDDSLPPPTSLDEAIQFLSNSFSFSFEKLFEKSVSILLNNISLITLEQLGPFSIEVFQVILKSDQFKILDEEQFLSFIFNLIEKDPKKKVLLKLIKFENFSSKTLQRFLSQVPLDQVDLDFFNRLKFIIHKFKELSESVSDENARIREEHQKNFEERNKLEEEKKKIIEMSDQTSDEKQKLIKVNTEIEEEKRKLSEFNNRILEEKQKLIETNTQAEEEKQKLIDKIHQIEEEKHQLEQKIDKIAEECQNFEKKNIQLLSEKQSLEKMISDLSNTITQIVSLESKFEAVNLQISKQDQKVEMQASQLSNLIFQIQTDKQKFEAQTSDLSNQVSQLQAKIQSLEKSGSTSSLSSSPTIVDPLISPHQSQIEQWVGKKKWQLLYKATRDGFKASDFHSKCDKQGSTVTIITSEEGYHFGGYTPLSWNSPSSSQYVQDSSKESFIFTLTNPHNIPPSKYPLIKPEHAVCCNSDRGPIFGDGCDICVWDQSDLNSDSFTHFPHSYSDATGKGKITFTGNDHFTTQEIEVFKVFE